MGENDQITNYLINLIHYDVICLALILILLLLVYLFEFDITAGIVVISVTFIAIVVSIYSAFYAITESGVWNNAEE